MKGRSIVGFALSRTGKFFKIMKLSYKSPCTREVETKEEKEEETSPYSPGVKLYRAENPTDSSSPSAKNLIHRNLPLDLMVGGFCCPQKRPIMGENPKGPSRTSM